MKIGVICPSEIALRRFMPALQLIDGMEFVGIGVCSREERFGNQNVQEDIVRAVLENEHIKAEVFVENYGGKIFEGYESIVSSDEIEAIYIPLPPALHYKWAKRALEKGKHVLVEKPSTISAKDTKQLVEIAMNNKLALHENYMFIFHNQLNAIDEIICSGVVGDIRLYRICFGFPLRDANDFRYSKALGGGALIDAGGYTIKYADRLLGESARIKNSQMNYIEGYEVDMFGSATMVNDEGTTVQIAFGMDNNYKCELEVWGSKGCLSTGRVLTAPVGFVPKAVLKLNNEEIVKELPADDAFKKSIEEFIRCINDDRSRMNNYKDIIRQAELVDSFRTHAESSDVSC